MTAPEQLEWDEFYAATDRIWSGRPNGALVTETADLPPGRALDVGCGEGADALWLASRGWQVTALDVSQVALDRAAAAAREAGLEVQWVHAGLLEAQLPVGCFDLVSAQYPVLLRTSDAVAAHALREAVAPGGTLLVVHHDVSGHQHDPETERRFDPADHVLPEQVAAVLGDDWVVEVDERRERDLTEGAGAHHVLDIVLRARRLR